jgi:hypothetical protein
MSTTLGAINLQQLNLHRIRHACEACGVQMRIRLTGPEILEGNKQTATYVCECGHEQSYVECLKTEESLADGCT